MQIKTIRKGVAMDLRLSLKGARANAGASQEDVAKALGITAQTVCRWENGKNAPNIYQYQELCDFLGVPVGTIFFKK